MATVATQPEQAILEEKSGAVLTIKLNRPDKQNRLTAPMCRTLLHALLTAGDDKNIRAIVLTGVGNDFSTGGDLEILREARERKSIIEIQELLTLGKEICLAMATMPKMIIAAVNGPAANAGMGLALASDLRIASDKATFMQAFTQLGLYPGFGSTYFLPRLIGLSRASELFYTGETLDAPGARRTGIVYQVFPSADFEKETKVLADHLAAGPPLAYRDLKRTMTGDKKQEMEDAFDEEIRLQTHCFTTEDCAEGLAAFFERRKPNFRGH